MIFTERQVTVRKGKATIDEPVILYRGDFEVSIKFTIMESKFRFKSGVNLVDSEKASHGQLAILAPYGGNVFSEVVKCEDGTVTFTLTKEMIDQLEEVGLYSFQIRLFDYYRESRVSIPPVEFGIEVREPVASEDHDNTVNNAIVGYSIAKVVDPKEENVGSTFDNNGQYNKTNWETGDRISEGKLNKIEDAIDKINQNERTDVADLNKRVTNNYNILQSGKMDAGVKIASSQLDISKDANKIKLVNLSDEVRSAMTGNASVSPVIENNSITNEKYADNSITEDKLSTEFKLPITMSPVVNCVENADPGLMITGNIVDIAKGIRGGYYDLDGKFIEANNFYYTEFIRVQPNEMLRETGYGGPGNYQTYWDINGQFVCSSYNKSQIDGSFNVPDDPAIWYMRTCWEDNKASIYGIYREKPLFEFELRKKIKVDGQQLLDGSISIDKLTADFKLPYEKQSGFIYNGTTGGIINIFELDKAITGGYYSLSGEWTSDGNFISSEFIRVYPGETIRQHNEDGHGNYKVFWDKNKNFISSFTPSETIDTAFQVPDANTIYYMTTAVQVGYESTFELMAGRYVVDVSLDENVKIPQLEGLILEPTQDIHPWANKKINFLGDSITEGYGTTKVYHDYLTEMLDLAACRNYGIGGSTVANGSNPMYSRALSMDIDADLVCVFGGTNDFAIYNRVLGELYSKDTNNMRVANTDCNTFYGALHMLCVNLINRYPDKKIVMFTPIHREVFGGQKTEFQPNGAGLYLDQYVDAVKEVAEWYSIPVCDLYSISGLQPNNSNHKSLYFSPNDGLHPKAEGHEVLARVIYNFLKNI